MKRLFFITNIVLISLFSLTACEKQQVEIESKVLSSFESKNPPKLNKEESEYEKLKEFCAEVAFFPSWDTEGKCDDFNNSSKSEKNN